MLTLDTERLYRVKKKDLPQIEELLTECFQEDPLYHTLIPDDDIREKLLPELFRSDLIEYFQECDIFAESEELNSIIIVSDESEVYNELRYYLNEFIATIRTDSYLIKEDLSLKTLHNFIIGKDYLNSKWTEELHDDHRIHIIYIAVRPSKQHHGLSSKLINEVIDYADREGLMISLETHNEKNLSFYQHYGFEVYDKLNEHFGLTQYCLVRNRKEDKNDDEENEERKESVS